MHARMQESTDQVKSQFYLYSKWVRSRKSFLLLWVIPFIPKYVECTTIISILNNTIIHDRKSYGYYRNNYRTIIDQLQNNYIGTMEAVIKKVLS